MESVAQFFMRDLPEIPWPTGCDLLQVFWCPNDHFIEYPDSEYAGPMPALLWLDSATENGAGASVHGPFTRVQPFAEPYGILPCCIAPERVTEFPDVEEFPLEIARNLQAADQARGLSYQYALSVARGWKIGGWASWHSTDLRDLSCPDCAGAVQLLLKVDSREWDGASDRWWPLEDRDVSQEALATVCEPTGVEVGRSGELRVFLCRDDPRHSLVLDIQ